ncbi:MAG: primosomal protein N' [Candidatus Hydrogenedentota bacterium]
MPDVAHPAHAYAEVVLPIPVDRPFTYAVPETLQERAAVGMRAVVSMRNRIETGYIVGLPDTTDVEVVKPLLDLPDDLPAFTPPMLDLCRWMADYYCCSWGEALQCAVPAGVKIGARMRYRLLPEQLAAGRYTDRQRQVIAALYERGPLTDGQLAAEVGRNGLSNTLQALLKRGIITAESVLRQGVNIRTETYVRLIEENALDAEAQAVLARRAPKQAAVYFDLLHHDSECAATALYEKHRVNATVLRALEEKGLIAREEREYYRRPGSAPDTGAGTKHTLNDEQQAAYTAIVSAMTKRQFQAFLMKGITGSGKTEVYLQAIEAVLALGRQAIMLIPEISLTPQTVGRLQGRFGEAVAVLHSGLSGGERYDEWRRAQRGEVRIVVGARSAIFAPLPDVGLIIVDEEHDTSYKQADTPRYHARDVAIMRAKKSGAVCVLGSATPSIESYYNTQRGKSVLLTLEKRATNASLPKVQLVDMRIEAKEHGGQVILSRTLEDAVRARVAQEEQVILLLNRRGFAPVVLCPMCGHVPECTDCKVSLTYHQHTGDLRCHYCHYTRPKPAVCDKCHFNPLIYLGTGTQKAEEYLVRTFAEARVQRMDADTTAGKGGHAKILGRFAAGETDILIGTQMLAKGHDYPGVTLVGVINADTGLSVPDFRAAENTFQLLTQVAGRAGRGARPGKVILQTYRPRHYAVQAAMHHDYHAFYSREIEHRADAGYPPLRRMASLLIESEDPQFAERCAMVLGRLVRKQAEALGYGGVEYLGPSPSTLPRIKKKYRWNMGMLSRSTKRLNDIARAARIAFEEEMGTSRVQLKIDLDPYGL